MQTLLDPAVLFFLLGVLAGAVRSDLAVPTAVSRGLSLYLLMALGLKGGFALAESGLSWDMARALLAAALMACIVPMLGYAVLRRRTSPFDAAGVAAAYGSVSAVTFVAAMQMLEDLGMPAGAHMTVAMVLMESPAVLMAVLLAASLRQPAAGATSGAGAIALGGGAASTALGPVLREAFTSGAPLLLMGSMAIGWLSGESGREALQPFTTDLFKGLLAVFLLDMGLTVARRFGEAVRAGPILLAYALIAPLVHAALALALGAALGMPAGDTAILMTLSASASYIVVPAVLRHALPEANPGLYVGLALGVTFPMNILVGIPLYAAAARLALG